MSAGRKPCVIGGTAELERLVRDVFELKQGKPGICPEFFGFQNWPEVVAFSQTEEGEDFRSFVQLVEQYDEGKLWAAIKSAQDNETNMRMWFYRPRIRQRDGSGIPYTWPLIFSVRDLTSKTPRQKQKSDCSMSP